MVPNVTPTTVAHLLNNKLAKEGLDKKVTTQQIYGYVKATSKNDLRKGVIEGVTPVTIDGEIAKAWIINYVERIKSGTSTTRVDYDALAQVFDI